MVVSEPCASMSNAIILVFNRGKGYASGERGDEWVQVLDFVEDGGAISYVSQASEKSAP